MYPREPYKLYQQQFKIETYIFHFIFNFLLKVLVVMETVFFAEKEEVPQTPSLQTCNLKFLNVYVLTTHTHTLYIYTQYIGGPDL